MTARASSHLRNDVDLAAGRSLVTVFLRELALCLGYLARAAFLARGTSRVRAPYWLLREFIGLIGKPLDSTDTVALTFHTPSGNVRLRIRKSQSDLYILREIFLFHMYELDVEPADPRSYPTIVDLGANAGLSAAYLAARYRATTVVAVEPIRENVDVLRANADLAGQDWHIEEAAVAHQPGYLEFFVSGVWSSCTAVPEIGQYRHSAVNRLEPVLERPSVKVPTVTVGDLLDRHGIGTVDLMKIDIEGGELDLLLNSADWLDRVRRVIIEIHDKYIDGDAVRDALLAHGLRPRRQHGACELYVRAT